MNKYLCNTITSHIADAQFADLPDIKDTRMIMNSRRLLTGAALCALAFMATPALAADPAPADQAPAKRRWEFMIMRVSLCPEGLETVQLQYVML